MPFASFTDSIEGLEEIASAARQPLVSLIDVKNAQFQ
jgi:hypothetical protein